MSNKQKFPLILTLIAIFLCINSLRAEENQDSAPPRIIKILQTSDIHGNFFPYDFIEQRASSGSLSRIYAYVRQEREKFGAENVLLLDNGDILQGQPTAYYYNFIDTTQTHLAARMLQFMGYNAATIGNHDIETGAAVYDRYVRQCPFPCLAANAIREGSNRTESYFKPFYIKEIQGLKIAVLGMITPAIPLWLPKNLWQDMYFESARSTAERWVPYLKNVEKADIIIGLFHLGAASNTVQGGIEEDGGLDLPAYVKGFNIIFLGHDHRPLYKKSDYENGESVVFLNPGANGNYLSEATITIDSDGRFSVDGELVNTNKYDPDSGFLARFRGDSLKVSLFVSEKIAVSKKDFSSREAYLGPSAFVDMIHRIQLDLTGADISFASPLSYNTEIKKGDILVSDMFKLYKYENLLYTMRLKGREIKDFLEFSYDLWINTMHSPDDRFLKITQKGKRYLFERENYNFDSAAGISYTVDATKPYGERITIDGKMKNGKRFSLDADYSAAINSYRGNGGGGHLTEGAGIAPDSLTSHITYSTTVDLRYYIMQWMKKEKIINPKITSDWKFIPKTWTDTAGKRDYNLLFNP
ncbi:MAG: 5'-nucleotidase C-terminal domain-containing protein [Dysgonamonadaceae bacterium]|jgi:2',3'-cyclic-nucleotide 2'-phosphodiesterase/3'-nucleotidase|nr:5'-nucleotidase C-terminal domain-containing protein [Dysgonamonadaceae bacterium]